MRWALALVALVALLLAVVLSQGDDGGGDAAQDGAGGAPEPEARGFGRRVLRIVER